MRIEPPPSLAWAIGNMPPATAAAAPPLEPPGERSVSQGLRLIPWRVFSAAVITPNAGVLVRPQSTKPASTSASTTSSLSLARALRRAVRAVGHRPSRHRREILDRHRHAEERRGVAVAQAAVGLGSGRAGLLVVAPRDGVELGVALVHGGQAGVEQLDGGDAPARAAPSRAPAPRRTDRVAPCARPYQRTHRGETSLRAEGRVAAPAGSVRRSARAPSGCRPGPPSARMRG